MARNFTIGVAGHVNHGKTSLVESLTGLVSDKLIEERNRSLSIEPSFLPWSLSSNVIVGLIDVPGHEKFIRQMVAGVNAIDYAIMVIAANEGIKNQTLEHIQILQLLGITNGVVVLTKSDLIESFNLDLIIKDVKYILRETFLSNSEIIPVSAYRREGLNMLKNIVLADLKKINSKWISDITRIGIDQVFSIHGVGRVVTGTLTSGTISIGDILEIQPPKSLVRVRGLQVFGTFRSSAFVGERVAVHLAFIGNKVTLQRGLSLTTPSDTQYTNKVDILLEVVEQETSERLERLFYSGKIQKSMLNHIIKFYSGTFEGNGKIFFHDKYKDKPNYYMCTITLTNVAPVITGDKYLIRLASLDKTIGGGRVLNHSNKREFFKSFVEYYSMAPVKKIEKYLESKEILLLEHANVLIEETLREYAVWTGMESINPNISKTIKDLQQSSIIETITLKQERFISQPLPILEHKVNHILNHFHRENPMKIGMKKQELLNFFSSNQQEIIKRYAIEQKWFKELEGQWSSLTFERYIPQQHHKTAELLLSNLIFPNFGLNKWHVIVSQFEIDPVIAREILEYWLYFKIVFEFGKDYYIRATEFYLFIKDLHKHTCGSNFTLSEAKEILLIPRKHLISFLELADKLSFTVKKEEYRQWQTCQGMFSQLPTFPQVHSTKP
jgi:selenocysteine-specific elongation factor